MTTIARFVLRHRKPVVILWFVAMIIGGATSQKTIDRLSFDFSLPGQDGYETAKQVLDEYGTQAENTPYMLVLAAPKGSKVDDSEAAATFAAVQKAVPGVRVVDKTAAGGNPVFTTDDGRAQFAYAFVPPSEGFVQPERDSMVKVLKANAPAGTQADLTGMNELAAGNAGDNEGPGVLVETLLGGLGALGVLAFVFASFLALIPLAIAAVAILSTFLILLILTTMTDISFIVQFLVSLVGLGVAIDYSLLIVTRWREERDHGRNNEDAIVRSIETAGHAVFFSGLTVAISLLALVLLPVPFLRSIGIGGMLIPLVSVAVTLTMLPALLGGIGPKIDWPKIRHENKASRFWTAWGKLIVRRRWIAAGVAVVILGALIVPAFDMKIGSPQSESLVKSGVAYDAFHVLTDNGVPVGALTPMEILTDSSTATAVATAAAGVNGVAATFPEGEAAGSRNGHSLVIAVPEDETVNANSTSVVRHVDDALSDISGVIGVTGFGALQLDYIKGVYEKFPLVLVLILAITYILLVRAFRSLLLPLKAVLLNVASLVATFGALVLFWQLGYGSEPLYNIEATGAITFWLPIMIFAFLFGLSMDYEVFILSRMREEWDTTRDTNAAVITGLGRTGRLVTSAALILFFAFMALSTGPQTDIKLLATGLGIGILLDATVVRMLLVPALVSLFGKWNWYLPDIVAKVLRVEPSSDINGTPYGATSRRPIGKPALD